MAITDDARLRGVFEFYASPALEWQVRMVGPHLHPGSELATVALAERAAHYGFAEGGLIVEIASALGGPARFVARRFAATVICVDFNPAMQEALARGAAAEGLSRRCLPAIARCERLPFAAASCDAAWSQDAICHMDKEAVLAEVARVLKPGAVFAFTDFIARAPLTPKDSQMLARDWAFPSLLRLSEYTVLLDRCGFEVLLAEDRTRAIAAQSSRATPSDQLQWYAAYAARHSETEARRHLAIVEQWADLVRTERTGYGMLIARRR